MQIGCGLSGDVPEEIIRAVSSSAEELGYSSFWLNYPRSRPADGLAALPVALESTRALPIGMGVVPLTVRTAEQIVAYFETASLPLGRLLLGIGSGNSQKGALDRVRAAAMLIGEHLDCRLVIAALGERMCSLAGEVADDVLFNFVTPETARTCSEWVRAAADAAGRPCPARYAYIRFAAGPGAAERIEADAGSHFARHLQHYTSIGATPLGAAIAATDSEDISGRLAAWSGALDGIVLKPLPADRSVAGYLDLVRLGIRGVPAGKL